MGGAAVARVGFVSGSVADAVADAIVNPVGSGFLVGFAGVNGALRAAGGDEYKAELARLPTTARGDVWPTGAGRLKARHVLHVVSPIWSSGSSGEREALRRIHERLLEVADGLGCRTVALPAIACGAHRFPVEVAAEIAVSAVEDALVGLPQIERVEFCFLDRRLLHDYYLRSNTYDATTAQFMVVRNDIVHLLQHDPELASLVGQVDDPAVVRAIDDTARELGHESSIGIASLYAHAARQVLQLEAVQPPALATREAPDQETADALRRTHAVGVAHHHVELVLDGSSGEAFARFAAFATDVLAREGFSVELTWARGARWGRDGEVINAWPFSVGGTDGVSISGYSDWLATVIDGLAEQAVDANLGWRRRMSSHDPLTGAQRITSFGPSLVQAVRSAGALVLFDLDGLVHVNDRFGYRQGDAVLRRIGRLLVEAVPSTGRAYRVGGDEFTVLLPGSNGASALAVAEHLRREIAALELPEPGSDMATRDEPRTGTLTARFAFACWGDGEQLDPGTVLQTLDDTLFKGPRVPNRVSDATGFL